MSFDRISGVVLAGLSNLDQYVSSSFWVIVCLVAGTVILHFLPSRPTKLPRVGTPWLLSFFDGRHAISLKSARQMEDGYTRIIKRTGKPFVMEWWCIDHVFLPSRYLLDLKRAQLNALSFSRSIYDIFLLYTSIGKLHSRAHDLMVELVKRHINTRLSHLIPILTDECDYAFEVELGDLETWTPVLVGKGLCRNDNYLEAAQGFSDSIIMNSLVLSMLPLGPLRHVLSRLLSFAPRARLRRAVEELLPTVQARLGASVDSGASSRISTDSDGIDWIIDLSKEAGLAPDTRFLTHALLLLDWAGSPPTASLVTQMAYQVLLEPHYLAPLRSEAETAFATFGFTEKALSRMPLMDLFICETNRLYPTGTATCARTVMVPRGTRFHDGLYLPAGSKIAVPTLAIHTDPDNFANPLVFDGFRFTSKSHEESANPNIDSTRFGTKSDPTTVCDTKLAFGYGKHACPGRFYAVRMAKLVFGKVITGYDMRWIDVKVRPPSFSANGQMAPNLTQKIELRKRVN
ncbi:putative cytochrome P450 [Xylariaceae sp. FL0594]|nr:putative cytochrome P450 [Xylariaceae sp. FL0594]